MQIAYNRAGQLPPNNSPGTGTQYDRPVAVAVPATAPAAVVSAAPAPAPVAAEPVAAVSASGHTESILIRAPGVTREDELAFLKKLEGEIEAEIKSSPAS